MCMHMRFFEASVCEIVGPVEVELYKLYACTAHCIQLGACRFSVNFR